MPSQQVRPSQQFSATGQLGRERGVSLPDNASYDKLRVGERGCPTYAPHSPPPQLDIGHLADLRMLNAGAALRWLPIDPSLYVDAHSAVFDEQAVSIRPTFVG